MLLPLTIALAAFLTFQVQFILGRALLPVFGGTPAVWTTSLLFFQVALLAGYAWAEQLTRRPLRRQLQWHLGFVAVATLGLLWPLGTGETPLLSLAPGADATHSPTWGVSRALLLACGLPFVALAATSPLLQSWAAREATARGDQRPVQRLYAVSNLGSLLGLVSYPFVFEPWLDLRQQAWLWSGAFVVFVITLASCARQARKLADLPAPVTPGNSRAANPPVRAGIAAPVPAGTADATATGRTGEWLLWLLLPAAGSALMLSISNAICQDVAVVPMLWVAPLAVYLLTYILPFRSVRWVPRNVLALLAALGCAASLFSMLWSNTLSAHAYIVAQLGSLGGLGLLLHGEVARLAPSGRRLPAYYLALSAGGALGGAFVSLAAPAWFSGYWELPLTVFAAWLLVLVAWARDRSSPLRAGGWVGPVLLLGVAGTLAGAWFASRGTTTTPELRLRMIAAGSLSGVVLGALLAAVFRPARHGAVTAIAVIALLLLVESLTVAEIRRSNLRLLTRERNFFGVVKVIESGAPGSVAERRELVHGWISHGVQFKDPVLRRLPVAYYTHSSGAAHALRLARVVRQDRPLRIGTIGLGAGAIAALTRPGEALRFYEINPAVIRIAQGDAALFTFLADAPARISVALGDGRQEMQRELARGEKGNFDVLLLDAFSSDAVPTHLLTVEAFELYRAHAAAEGCVIGVHITNRHLDLTPLMRSTARHFGWDAQCVTTSGDAPLPFANTWMLFGTAPGLVSPDSAAAGGSGSADEAKWPAPWTDRFSSLLPLLR